MKEQENFINKIFNLLINGLVILLPLFFLPITFSGFGSDDFNKSYLLWLLVPLVFFTTFFSILKNKKTKLIATPLNVPIVIFIVVYSLATFFSLDWFSSLFGSFHALTLPLINVLTFALMFFLLVNFPAVNTKKILRLITIFYPVYIFLACIFLYSEQLISSRLGALVQKFLELSIGSFEQITLFISVINIIIIGLLWSNNFETVVKTKIHRIIIKTFLIISFLILLTINISQAWWLMFLSFLLYFYIFRKNRPGDNGKMIKRNIFPLLLIAFTLVIIIINFSIINPDTAAQRLASKLVLSPGSSLNIATEIVKTKPILGYGPESFNHTYSLLRDEEENVYDYWFVRFNKPSLFLVELLNSSGVLGLISYLIILLVSFSLIIKSIVSRKIELTREASLNKVLGVSVLALILLQIVFTINTSLLVYFWLLLAIFIRNLSDQNEEKSEQSVWLQFKRRTISKDNNASLFQTVYFFLIFVVVIWFMLFAFQFKFSIAQAYYNLSLTESNLDLKEKRVLNAVTLNKQRYQYKVALAKIYKERAIRSGKTLTGEKELISFETQINKSIGWARDAINSAPFAVSAQEALGIIYRDASFGSIDSQKMAARAFQEATKLEPSNPVLFTEAGKAFLEAEVIDQATLSLQKAKELKPDYFDANFYLAKSYALSGKGELALEIYEELIRENKDIRILFEMGKVYYNQGKTIEAISKFKDVIKEEPDHANALYSLAVALNDLGLNKEAIELLEKVEILNPKNKTVKDKIKEFEINLE